MAESTMEHLLNGTVWPLKSLLSNGSRGQKNMHAAMPFYVDINLLFSSKATNWHFKAIYSNILLLFLENFLPKDLK